VQLGLDVRPQLFLGPYLPIIAIYQDHLLRIAPPWRFSGKEWTRVV
jgi:hypothetical protein